MHSIKASNVNTAYVSGLYWLRVAGVEEQSRNGRVVVAPEPVCTTYLRPWQRVLFSPDRDANPFFHLMEAIWMMAGRQDVEWPSYFAKQLLEYSDNGITLAGAYGYRWREYFGYDQITEIVNILKDDPLSRRAVMSMWDGFTEESPKDKPCNTHIYFDCRGGVLNMTVCCRSNDAVWGTYGANVVHMSVLQEVMAAGIGIPIGQYRQMSNNFHAYPDTNNIAKLIEHPNSPDYYKILSLKHYPLVDLEAGNMADWLVDAENFIYNPTANEDDSYVHPFFREVAYPMYMAWHSRKNGETNGLEWVDQIEAEDWQIACTEWIQRRME